MNDELRLLAQPLHRYESKDPSLDGSLFGFAQTTTPMVILRLETRRVGESNRWHYAIARFSTQPITVSFGDKEVFSVERYNYDRDPKQPFFQLPRSAIPNE
jgi:hypothetical protein